MQRLPFGRAGSWEVDPGGKKGGDQVLLLLVALFSVSTSTTHPQICFLFKRLALYSTDCTSTNAKLVTIVNAIEDDACDKRTNSTEVIVGCHLTF